MRPKVTKFVFGGIANISVRRFSCSEYNIWNVVNIFEHENVIMEIGDVDKNSTLFRTMKHLNIHYETSRNDDSQYTDVAVMVNVSNLRDIIHDIVASECESFSINDIVDSDKWGQYMVDRFGTTKLLRKSIIKLNIVVAINESTLDMMFCNDVYDVNEIFLKVKEQVCVKLKVLSRVMRK